VSDGLDPVLFAPGPARDERFVVRDRWAECVNLPADHPQKTVEFLHRQMNEEVNGLECSARSLADFPDADWELRLRLARQCADEARHALAFRRALVARGGQVGEWPVLNFQYRIVTHIQDLVGRLAVQNRSFEAEGLDAISFGIGEMRVQGDAELLALFDAQLADEITHVRFANEWIRELTRRDPRNALRIARALTDSSRAFRMVIGPEGSRVVKYGVDPVGRIEAGFRPHEVASDAHRVATERGLPSPTLPESTA
jgi:uncharacterized ferritin-like protein (DUF455 family)